MSFTILLPSIVVIIVALSIQNAYDLTVPVPPLESQSRTKVVIATLLLALSGVIGLGIVAFKKNTNVVAACIALVLFFTTLAVKTIYYNSYIIVYIGMMFWMMLFSLAISPVGNRLLYAAIGIVFGWMISIGEIFAFPHSPWPLFAFIPWLFV
jgi:hypothetical protein